MTTFSWPEGGRINRVPLYHNTVVPLLTGIILEAKGIKEHHWKPFIKQLYEKKV